MPYRHPIFASMIGSMTEGFLFLGTAMFAGFRCVGAAIDDGTWEKVKGAEGALFIVVCGIIAIWFSKGQSEKKADKRHEEMMQLHEENAMRLAGLTAEAIKSNMAATHEIRLLTAAQDRLTKLLERSPCVALTLGLPVSQDRTGHPATPETEL